MVDWVGGENQDIVHLSPTEAEIGAQLGKFYQHIDDKTFPFFLVLSYGMKHSPNKGS